MFPLRRCDRTGFVFGFDIIVTDRKVGILLGKSALESVLYSQLLAVRIGKNVYAWAADLFVLLFSLPICMTLDKTVQKMFPKLAAKGPAHE